MILTAVENHVARSCQSNHNIPLMKGQKLEDTLGPALWPTRHLGLA